MIDGRMQVDLVPQGTLIERIRAGGYEGLASPEDIDSTLKLGANHPMGPLSLADLIGLDIVLDIMETLYRGFDDPKFRPSPLLKHAQADVSCRISRTQERPRPFHLRSDVMVGFTQPTADPFPSSKSHCPRFRGFRFGNERR